MDLSNASTSSPSGETAVADAPAGVGLSVVDNFDCWPNAEEPVTVKKTTKTEDGLFMAGSISQVFLKKTLAVLTARHDRWRKPMRKAAVCFGARSYITRLI